MITLKNAAGASSLVITGGTEVGHASGTFSHANGYKGQWRMVHRYLSFAVYAFSSVDVRHATIVDNYITNTFTRIADRSDGFPQWEAASGNIYCVRILQTLSSGAKRSS